MASVIFSIRTLLGPAPNSCCADKDTMHSPRISDAIFCDINFKNSESCRVGIISDELGDGPLPMDMIIPPNLDGPSEIEMKKAFSYFKILTSNFRFSVSTAIVLWSELDIICLGLTYAFIAIASCGLVSIAVLDFGVLALRTLGSAFAVFALAVFVFLGAFVLTTIGSSTWTVSSTVSTELIPVAS